MINLLDYYKDNVKEDEYYYKFYNKIVSIPEEIEREIEQIGGSSDSEEFEFYDDEDILEKFKYLCLPEVDITTDLNTRLFYFICFYLNMNGYTIKEFPRVLSRPPMNPLDFTYIEI